MNQNVTILNVNTNKEIDNAIIPEVIYNETINKEREKIENYLILHPKLLLSFVGYNGALKLANQLASDKKCGCYYKIPWLTHYASINNLKVIGLSFSQQVEEYRYMILYWKPSPEISHMQYLSQIALTMIQQIRQFLYYRTNNLEYCTLNTLKYYTNNFNNERAFLVYLNLNFSNFHKVTL
jgi:hypothetical protein